VFGGTQVGKSTAVNVIAGQECARVHHTAGFTRHAQAFIPAGADPDDIFGTNPYPFSRFLRTTLSSLSNDRLTEYCVESLPTQPAVGQAVLWDAPDCDAVGSRNYLPGMVEALAIADVLVYVTSSQKYAIRHVLEWVAELRESGKPVIGLLNMTPKAHQSDLIESMRGALRTVTGEIAADLKACMTTETEDIPVVAFEFVPDGDGSILIADEYRPGRELRKEVSRLIRQSKQKEEPVRRGLIALEWLQSRLPFITAPALAESQAREDFAELADRAIAEFVSDYESNYLDNAANYDAFTLVGLEILKLLDPPIPGAKQAIVAMRTVVGIPARLVVAGAKSLYRSINPKAAGGDADLDKTQPRDMAAVRRAHEGLLNTISREVARKAAQAGNSVAFWKALDWCWEKALADIEAEFRVHASRLHDRHQAAIRETAQKIYNELAKDPVKLNLLRSGRLSADAAAIVLSIKTGGQGGELLHSMVVAPVLLSLTEAASQAIADNHVMGLREQLRRKLLEETRDLGKRVYAPRLSQVASEAATLAGFSQIDGSTLRSLPERIDSLRSLLLARARSTEAQTT
jgi:hypothetical protein